MCIISEFIQILYNLVGLICRPINDIDAIKSDSIERVRITALDIYIRIHTI